MRASWYSQALYEVLASHKGDEEKLLKQFKETVIRNGHAHMFSKILRSYERLLAKKQKEATIEVTSATPLSEKTVAELLRASPYKNVLSTTHRSVVRKVDETITGGVVVRTSTMRIDASYKRMLLELYQKITKNL